ncbi:hypothetical protein ERO13_D13G085900v2 [Gossypium hirsutum]|uniref:Transcription factor BIM2 isoform X1 n=3 Tax=Gossypium TaxID=3633 RepID=A0A1U8KZ73_GOSHI|nr:transcription factor BIM2 isoform X1 [Gossypium hirsutum]KAG4111076.1 hypothetical protein ERO13_D13G085900v2 [Gossypium hirsutum]TYI46315.1 hypothetical protein E1A91_D13G099100v1 [Gossypium mustelinum]
MRTGKGSQEEEEYEEEEFGSKKGGFSSNQTMSFNPNNNSTTNKDGKNNDKANAIRSKHSVTEQRRRSKINERFQRLRDLIPNTDQKRDTASFLLEVIEYVQYLQEKVQKYEDSYQGWSSEPAKLMPWRNSHWHVQSLVGHPQAIKNGSGPGATFARKFDENNTNINPTVITSGPNAVETDPIRYVTSKTMDCQTELANNGTHLPIQGENVLVHPLRRPVSETQSTECLVGNDIPINQQEDLTIEGGTISISSVYSQGLLSALAQALQGSGLDLSQANMSVQIDLGKHANRGLSAKEPHNSPHQAMTHLRDVSSGEDSDHAQKRLKK